AIGADHARLEIFPAAGKVVTRIADAPGERHHDRKTGARMAGDLALVAEAGRDVAPPTAGAAHPVVQQGRTTARDADFAPRLRVLQDHDRLCADVPVGGAVSRHARSPL